MLYLAQHLGQPSFVGMLEKLSPFEWGVWQAYMREQPFGEIREDARHAMRAYMFARANTKKGARVELDQFIPKFGPAGPAVIKRDSPELMLAQAKMFTLALGGKLPETTKGSA